MNRFFIFFFILLSSLDSFAQVYILRGEGAFTVKYKMKNSDRELKVFIHFSQGNKQFAENVLAVVKSDIPRVNEYFKYTPQSDVHFTVNNQNSANGSATVFPRNIIQLTDSPPAGHESLTAPGDWIRTLVIHEYIHVLTLEMTHGFLDFFRNVFGSTMKWGAIVPRWFAEGIAVWGESYFSDGGRIRNPWIKREVLKLIENENFCYDFSCFDALSYFPHGHSAYWVGGYFLDYIERHYPNTMSCVVNENSRKIPFRLRKSFETCIGKELVSVLHDFITELRSEKMACPLKSDASLCAEIEKKPVDWFAGHVKNDKNIFYVVNEGGKGFRNEPKKESVIRRDLKTGKYQHYIFDLPIEYVYSPNSKDIYVSVIDAQLDQMERVFYRFNGEKFVKADSDACDSSRIFYYFESEKAKYCVIYQTPNWAVVTVENGKKKKDKIQEFGFLTDPKMENNQITFKKHAITNQDDKKAKPIEAAELKEDEVRKYQGVRYLDPTYLMLNYYSGGNIDSYGMVTSLSDPLGKHSVQLEGYYNQGVPSDHSPFSGFATYAYNYANFIFSPSYQKMITESSLRVESFNISERKSFSFGYLAVFDYSTLFSSITADQVREIDVIFGVKRDLVTYRLSTIYDYATTSTSATLRSYHLRGEVRSGEEKDGKQYWGEMGKASAWLRPHLDFSLFPTVAYGKLNKTRRFRDGVLYGGGANSFFNGSYFFNSYLAPYTDIFGNEILTSQIKTEWVLSRPFWGSGFVPLNIRAVSLVTGAEYIATDYLIADQRLYADQEFFGAIGGFKLDTILFYWLPVGLELVYSKILDNDIDQDWVGQLLLTTNLSF